jgi:hypothetical protein
MLKLIREYTLIDFPLRFKVTMTGTDRGRPKRSETGP